MSSHPNVILMVALTPGNLSRATMRNILAETNTEDDDDVKINSQEYRHLVMESDYDESDQVRAKEGDLVFFDLVTYGYGETIGWEKLEARKRELEEWAKAICERHACTYRIEVSANYW